MLQHWCCACCRDEAQHKSQQLQDRLQQLTAQLEELQAAHQQLQATHDADQAAWAAKEQDLAGVCYLRQSLCWWWYGWARHLVC